MKPKVESDNSAAKESRVAEDAVCDLCGRFGAFHIGDRTLCENCYEGCGSCCPEFGKDDLWRFSDSK